MAKKRAPVKKSVRKVVAPAATIVKKRSLFVPIVVAIIVVVAAVAIYLAVRPSNDGTILATVNGKPLYASDIDEQYQQVPAEYHEQYTREFILAQMIDRELLLQEGERRGLAMTDEEIDTQVRMIADQFGISEGELYDLLKKQNLTLQRYRKLVGEELLLSKVVQDAVLSRVTVSDEEVIHYYESHQSNYTAPPGGAVISHILVSNESEAKEVLKRLGQGDSFEALAKEYSIDSSGASGGYLGIVTLDTPFIEEFKTAALALRVGQYTRTPVQTQYGYHIILRGPDTEPFSLVRDTIQAELKQQHQVEAFQQFLADLRAKAKITYYTQRPQKATTTPSSPALDTFAICLSQRATLYGTSWSEFFKEQTELFGESKSKLTIVDCDESPKICAEANIQKYPTWVLSANGEQLGKSTLSELADKTGCELQ